jgi:23S rRNA (pseudouridine1915-N3)-methyltransferase
MRIVVLAVGSPRDRNMAQAIREYETRVARYFRFEALEVVSGSGGGSSPSAVRTREGNHLRKQIPDGLATWALSRNGDEISSRELADALSEMATYGLPGVAFLVGGAFGLDQSLIRGSTRTLSLSRMTLPHDMARLMLAEQLYRAGTILRGEPYHKGGVR